jgi:hypothetical protein
MAALRARRPTMSECLRKNQNRVINFPSARAVRGAHGRRRETFCTVPATEKDFFIWIRCNPLKSHDSDE